MTTNLYIVNVQGAIYHEGKYLFGRRGDGEDYLPGELGLPGGKTETVDHDAYDVTVATLKREIMEEVNVSITDPHIVITRFFEADGDNVMNIVYLCKYDSGEPKAVDLEETSEILWMTKDEAIQHPDCLEWTHLYITKADDLRQELGWA